MKDPLALGVTRVHENGTQERWELTASAASGQSETFGERLAMATRPDRGS